MGTVALASSTRMCSDVEAVPEHANIVYHVCGDFTGRPAYVRSTAALCPRYAGRVGAKILMLKSSPHLDKGFIFVV